MAYSNQVIDHYENPRNVGSFSKDEENIGTGMVGAPACGDVMKLQIKVNPETGVIEDARFKTYGCGSAIASSSLVTEWVRGRTLEEAFSIRNSEIAEELAPPPIAKLESTPHTVTDIAPVDGRFDTIDAVARALSAVIARVNVVGGKLGLTCGPVRTAANPDPCEHGM